MGIWADIGLFLLGMGVGITVGFYVAEREWNKKSLRPENRTMENRSSMESLQVGRSSETSLQEEGDQVHRSFDPVFLWEERRRKASDGKKGDLEPKDMADHE